MELALGCSRKAWCLRTSSCSKAGKHVQGLCRGLHSARRGQIHLLYISRTFLPSYSTLARQLGAADYDGLLHAAGEPSTGSLQLPERLPHCR